MTPKHICSCLVHQKEIKDTYERVRAMRLQRRSTGRCYDCGVRQVNNRSRCGICAAVRRRT